MAGLPSHFYTVYTTLVTLAVPGAGYYLARYIHTVLYSACTGISSNNGYLTALGILHRLNAGTEDSFCHVPLCHVQRRAGLLMKGRYLV